MLGQGPVFEQLDSLVSEGRVTGKDVFLLESGSLASVSYRGTWSQMGLRSDHSWKATVRELEPEQLFRTHEPSVLKEIVSRVRAAMEAQIEGKKDRRTVELVEFTQLLGSVGYILGYEAARRRRR